MLSEFVFFWQVMAIIGFIRVGDQTVCGGTIIGGDSSADVFGRALALRGSKVACRKNCVLVEHVQDSTLFGNECVVHGMKTSGGCPCLSTLNGVCGIEYDRHATPPPSL
jgi:uncharacterized Zn-binding protein involved in type VI secretion